jgi:hypothetical protein
MDAVCQIRSPTSIFSSSTPQDSDPDVVFNLSITIPRSVRSVGAESSAVDGGDFHALILSGIHGVFMKEKIPHGSFSFLVRSPSGLSARDDGPFSHSLSRLLNHS